jgi:hypothetical protein
MLLGVYAQATETGKRAAVDGVSATLGPADGRQQHGIERRRMCHKCAMATPAGPRPVRPIDGRTSATPGLQRVEVRGIEPLASTVRLLRSAN